MSELVPPSAEALSEALTLAEEIVRDIELSQISLSAAALRSSRLARLLNDVEAQRIFEYETSGYPTDPAGISAAVWELGVRANRRFNQLTEDNSWSQALYTESIERLEAQFKAAQMHLEKTYSSTPGGNSLGEFFDRTNAERRHSELAGQISARRSLIHQYAVGKYYELKFSKIAGDVFARQRERLGMVIWKVVPTAVQKFVAVHENLRSSNPEDWANAVHSCRRILQDLADAVFPPQPERVKGSKVIKLGVDNYVNRLIAFVEENSGSQRFNQIVGSSLAFLGDRLDAVFLATQKGSHSEVAQEEADRFVIYTYMIVGDILSLWAPPA